MKGNVVGLALYLNGPLIVLFSKHKDKCLSGGSFERTEQVGQFGGTWYDQD